MGHSTALVTGASGYIGLHIVSQLLQRGWDVHSVVRNLDESNWQPLADLRDQYRGKLRISEADLLRPDSFLEPMQGCSVVLHVASPFLLPEAVKDAQRELVDPAVQGTRNILDCVNKTESVQRVVLTSSAGAIYGDNIDVCEMENGVLSEKYLNQSSTLHHNAYQYSKTLAENEASEIYAAQDRWELVVLCPTFVLGPSLTPSSRSGSLATLERLLRGYMALGVPDLAFHVVDVRDVATAHVQAAELISARGRYIISPSTMTPLVEISRFLRSIHDYPWLLPTWNLPSPIFCAIGTVTGLSQRWMASNLGIRFSVNNTRSIHDLGMEYRPLEETLSDHHRQWATQRTR